jgi:hypothetical protein
VWSVEPHVRRIQDGEYLVRQLIQPRCDTVFFGGVDIFEDEFGRRFAISFDDLQLVRAEGVWVLEYVCYSMLHCCWSVGLSGA